MPNEVQIPARLRNVSFNDPYVASVEDIIDDNAGQTQQEINRAIVDKPYSSADHSGMGRVNLQKHLVNIAEEGEEENVVNLLTQDMLLKGEPGSREPNTNTAFVIQYDYTLGDVVTNDITIGSEDTTEISDVTYYYTTVELEAGKCLRLLDVEHCVLLEDTTALLNKEEVIATEDTTVYIASTTADTYTEAYSIENVITIPANCTLDFQGGSIKNGTVVLNMTEIINNAVVDNIHWSGNIANGFLDVSKYGLVPSEVEDLTDRIQNLANLLQNNGGGVMYFPNGNYRIEGTLVFSMPAIKLKGDGMYQDDENSPDGFTNFITYGEVVIECVTPYYYFAIDGINFYSQISRQNQTYLIKKVGSSYFSRLTFKNMYIRNYHTVFDLMGDNRDNYADGVILDTIKFDTCNRCIRAKHFESSVIKNCIAEPFTQVFAELYQPQNYIISDCIIRSVSDHRTGSIGFIISGSGSYGWGGLIQNLIMEDVEAVAWVGVPGTIFRNIKYTINFTRTYDTFTLMKSGGLAADNVTIDNILIVLENETPSAENIYDIRGVLQTSTITIGENSIATGGAKIKGLSVHGWNPTIYAAGTTLYFATNVYNKDVFKKNNKCISFDKDDTFDNTDNSLGESWKVDDVIIRKRDTNANFNSYIGLIKTKNLGVVPFGMPLISAPLATIKNYSPTYVGTSAFDTTNGKPVYWNGTAWVDATGATV